MADELWTTDDVARLLAFTPATVREMVSRGELPAFRVGGRLRFDPAAVRAALQARAVEPRPARAAPARVCRPVRVGVTRPAQAGSVRDRIRARRDGR